MNDWEAPSGPEVETGPSREKDANFWMRTLGLTVLLGAGGLAGSLTWRFLRRAPHGARVAWSVVAGALGAGATLGIVLLIAATSYHGPSAANFDGQMVSQLRSHWGVKNAQVRCVMPGAWKPGVNFSCYVYRSGNFIGSTQEEVIPAVGGNAWEWLTRWYPN